MDLAIAGKWALVCGASKGLGFGCAQALVCGASKGLGFGCAQALVREGVHVLIVARGAEVLEAAANKLIADSARPVSATVQFVAADITTVQGRAAVFALRKEFDIVVTNAGGPPPGGFRDWDRGAWIKAVDANMLTPIELIKATVDGMAARGFGRIVNITSSSVKSPIDALGLSVQSLADARRKNIPAQRFGTLDEFGAICAFLCSVQAGYMTGQNVLADGGAYPGTF